MHQLLAASQDVGVCKQAVIWRDGHLHAQHQRDELRVLRQTPRCTDTTHKSAHEPCIKKSIPQVRKVRGLDRQPRYPSLWCHLGNAVMLLKVCCSADTPAALVRTTALSLWHSTRLRKGRDEKVCSTCACTCRASLNAWLPNVVPLICYIPDINASPSGFSTRRNSARALQTHKVAWLGLESHTHMPLKCRRINVFDKTMKHL